MKYSIYNSVLPLTKTSSMVYNASSDKFLVFRKELEEYLKQSPSDLQNHGADLYKEMSDNGFIVDDDKDEIADMIALGLKYCNNESRYRLIVNPTTNCNFNCWYCYEQHSPAAKMQPDTVEKVKRMIARIAERDKVKHLELSFFGGEPLLYYRDTVEPIIDAARTECAKRQDIVLSIHFTTNGFLVSDYVISHLTRANEHKSFQITLDGGREQHDKVRFTTAGKGSYDRILANIKRLLTNGMGVDLRINYTKENIKSVRSILDDLNDIDGDKLNLFAVDFQKVWQEDGIERNDETLDSTVAAFRERFPRVYNHFSHADSFRNPCYADMKNECVVNYNGNVYKCTARDFTYDNRLGELNEDGIVVWDDPDFVENRVCRKLRKKVCNECRIFPICGGGCVQNALEHTGDQCPKYGSELEKDEIILMRFYNSVVKKSAPEM